MNAVLVLKELLGNSGRDRSTHNLFWCELSLAATKRDPREVTPPAWTSWRKFPKEYGLGT